MNVLAFTNRMSTLVTEHELCEEKSCTLQITLNYFYSLLPFSSIRRIITCTMWLKQSLKSWTFSKTLSEIFGSQEFHSVLNSLIFAWITESKETFY